MSNKIERYVVFHMHKAYERSQPEEAWVSYSTALDGLGMSALRMAIHTAARYKGEIFTDKGDGVLEPFKSYVKKTD